MAIFHLKSQIIKRSDKRSTVACAAYRAGEDLRDERYGKTQTYKRQDRVAHSEIIAPDFAQPWATDRAQLWNSLEAVERRKDAQLATEIEVALPHELPKRLQRELLIGFIDEHYTKKGFVADFNIHHAPIGKPWNDHCHIMVPLRAMDPDTGEFRKTKDRQESMRGFNDTRDAEIEKLRASWASHVNAALAKEGIDDQHVDHRSHKRRGITDVQPGIHVGYAGQGIEERGGRSWRAEHNRQIGLFNRQILERIKAAAVATYRDLANKLAPAKKEQEPAPAPIAAKPAPTMPPKLPPLAIPDIEAEKRKKDAHHAARLQQGGGGVGG
jgi:ATP-dependent exoDNAse (exonuclease V) alpha subunit